MDPDGLRRSCVGQPGAVEEFPFGEQASVFKVAGKVFAIAALGGVPLEVSLKCDPDLAEAVRAEHAAVRPGYHLNKRHWNTVTLDGSIPDAEIDAMIQDSYDLVVARLTRAKREALRPGSDGAPGCGTAGWGGRLRPMETYRAIITKRDTRRFRPDPVDESDLHRILEAGRMAGSAKNEQVNRLLVVTDEQQRTQLAECGRFSDWIPAAPVVIVFVVPAQGARPFDYGRMAQNMMVMANSLGLASCPMTFHDEGCARELLGLPDDLTAPMGVAVGRPGPADPDRTPSPRVPLEELVRWGRWSD